MKKILATAITALAAFNSYAADAKPAAEPAKPAAAPAPAPAAPATPAPAPAKKEEKKK